MNTISIKMTSDEANLLRGLIGQEIDSIKVIGLESPDIETPYTRTLSLLEERLVAA